VRYLGMKRSLSYADLMLMHQGQPEELERLVLANLLDDASRARIAHLSRFLTCLGELVSADTKVGDALTPEEVQAIWRETADPGASDDEIGAP
jgi:hypothetical protein